MVSEPANLATKLNEYFRSSIQEISQFFLKPSVTQEHIYGDPIGVTLTTTDPAAGTPLQFVTHPILELTK